MENKRKIFLTFGVTKSPECYAAEEAVKQKKQENKKSASPQLPLSLSTLFPFSFRPFSNANSHGLAAPVAAHAALVHADGPALRRGLAHAKELGRALCEAELPVGKRRVWRSGLCDPCVAALEPAGREGRALALQQQQLAERREQQREGDPLVVAQKADVARFARGRGGGAPGRASERLCCRNAVGDEDDVDICACCPRSCLLVRGDGTLVPRPARQGGFQLGLAGEREEFA